MTRTTESLRHVCYLFAPVHTNGTLVIILSKGRLYNLHKTGPQRCVGAGTKPSTQQSPSHALTLLDHARLTAVVLQAVFN